MTNTPLNPPQQVQDRLARKVVARLVASTAELPYHVTERLRAARVQAVARRRLASARVGSTVIASGGSATLTFGDEGWGFWSGIGSALPLIALVAGLVLIHTFENDRRASELAEVDAALLTDDLPPAAYADSGFVQFLKSGGE